MPGQIERNTQIKAIQRDPEVRRVIQDLLDRYGFQISFSQQFDKNQQYISAVRVTILDKTLKDFHTEIEQAVSLTVSFTEFLHLFTSGELPSYFNQLIIQQIAASPSNTAHQFMALLNRKQS